MNILIACEYSGTVRDAFIRRGHNAVSCDLLPSESDFGPHIQGDVLPLLEQDWDLVVAFPSCTDLCSSGAAHFAAKRADGRQAAAIEFFMAFVRCPALRLAIENPIGVMSSEWRKPDQIIQPYWFGDPVQKSTCLWLSFLSPLVRTVWDCSPVFYIDRSGKKRQRFFDASPSPTRGKDRSKMFQGIAEAMATQWGEALSP